MKNKYSVNFSKKLSMPTILVLIGCAVIVIGVCIGVRFIKKKSNIGNVIPTTGNLTVEAVIPTPTAAKLSVQKFMEGDEHWNWWNSYRELISKSELVRRQMDGFYLSLMEKLLPGKDENTVCSPLNTYIAFSMLAEITEENTRKQVLDMLGVPDIKTLRDNIQSLWESNYVDTPILKSLLANSLWLRNDLGYNSNTLDTLAQEYHASSFSGILGSDEMNKALQTWTDSNTGGLLSEYTKDMSLDADTVLALVSTIYYKALWINEFSERNTSEEIFHGTKNETTVDMMHKTEMMSVYSTDEFTALGLGLNDSGAMYFFLPKDVADVDSLASNPDILKATGYGEDEHWSHPEVNLSIPKFKVQDKLDLMDVLPKMGVTDALDPVISDYTALTEERDDLFLDTAEHAASVEIDENGVTGAAYTMLDVNAGATLPQEKIDFVVDRPFMFMITARDGSILFSGIIKNLE